MALGVSRTTDIVRIAVISSRNAFGAGGIENHVATAASTS